MKWEINENLPIHNQLVEEIIRRVINKEYLSGQRIPSVRELSLEARVNPNTMQKALLELEERGIIYTQRTSGKFITEDEAVIKKLKTDISDDIVRKFIKDMNNLGFSENEIINILRKE